MSNAFLYLVSTPFNLFLITVLLRFWLQMTRADFYNPLSQFVVKVTSPLLNPIRKVIPGLGGFDLASLVLAIIVSILKFVVIFLLFFGALDPITILKRGLIDVLFMGLQVVSWVMIIRALLSWVSQGHNPIEALFHQLTEPMLRPIRKIIPPVGGLDLSILVVFFILQFLILLF